MTLSGVILLFCCIQGMASGSRINLFDALLLNKTTAHRFPGIKLAQKGYLPAYQFGQRTGDLTINSQYTALFINSFHSSNDVTLYFTFKMHSNARDKVGTLVSISSPKTMRTYLLFTLGIMEKDPTQIEGLTSSLESRKRYVASLGLEYEAEGRTVGEKIVLGSNSTMEHWVTGMVRIQNRSHVTVYMNCRPIIKRRLKKAIGNIPEDAEIRVTQSCAANFWTGAPQVVKRLLATISRADVFFGESTFQELNGCPMKLSDNTTLRKLPAPGSLQTFERSPSSCTSCGACFFNGKRYKHDQVFYWRGQPCSSCTCNNGRVKCNPVVCPKLICRYGTRDSEGCCQICRETECAQQGKVFRFGCQRKCDDWDFDATCRRVRIGCYCPRGMVENVDGKCVRPKDCTCKVREGGETKVFKTNTVIALDKCRFCACNRGKMRCLIYC